MFGGIVFVFWRIVQITFLIPIVGMLAYFINGFLDNNQLTPAYILVLFIVSVIAVFWSFDTMIRYSTTRRSAIFVAFIDLCFFGAFIAGVYELRFIADQNCGHWDGGSVLVSLGPFGEWGIETNKATVHLNKTCAMLKTSFAFGIMEVVFFFWTALVALFIHQTHHEEVVVKETTVRRRSHSSRRGDSRHGDSRHGHSSHRRSSSGRAPQYVV